MPSLLAVLHPHHHTDHQHTIHSLPSLSNFSEFHKFPLPTKSTKAPALSIIMLLKTILVPLSTILAVVSALPTGADTALVAGAELEVRGVLPYEPAPGGDEDDDEIIDITSWVARNPPGVSPRSDQVFARDIDLNFGLKCSNTKGTGGGKILAWFTDAQNQQVCVQSGKSKTWRDGKNLYRVSNGEAKVRCNKFRSYAVNVVQLGNCQRPQVCGGGCWGRDRVYSKQTYALWSE